MVFLIKITIFLIFITICYLIGRNVEKKHYKKIEQKEKELSEIIIITSKFAPENCTGGELKLGSTVIGSDYFKNFLASLIGIFGGRVTPFESLLDRARREAIIRLKEQAKASGSNMIVNVKFETSTVNYSKKKKSLSAMVEVLAYGSCVKYLPE